MVPKFSAELLGTFWLVLGGCGSAVLAAAFPDVGIGLHGRTKRLGLIGGFTYQNPKVRSPLLDPDFNTQYAIVGAEWFVARSAKIYSEAKIDVGSVSPTGVEGDSVFTLGFRYDFAWRASHK